ncbi:hypothetical protein FC64_GL000836 [Ligilactobacillus araffinosus DSM 20653]|uniref:Replication protein n=1 Tax=Ligilactobacillus araffinosus DSM 20653 TaxID=1423820 RepID=A0A0R1ZBS7_9LACO|nr:hypothetical protein FC64_GL000836 [Ligilactobacillus araffinosus DSM 20653]
MQQLDKLPLAKDQSIDKKISVLIKRIKNVPEIKRYALIIHDKDSDKDGNAIKPHVHVMLELDKQRSVNKIAKALDDSSERLESMIKKYKRHGIENGYAYLIHQTQGAEKKYQYSPEKVKANFDYPKYIKKLQQRVRVTNKKSDKEFIKEVLNNYLAGKISEIEAKRKVLEANPLMLPRFLRQLDAVKSTKFEIESDEWFKNRSENNKSKSVVWISGHGGTGKTVLAKMIAENVMKSAYYMSGSDKDYFQDYNGEHCVILDEFRPDKISYSDLLKMLDNNRFDVNAPSRYHDKKILADLIIITSPYNPARYYQNDESIRPTVDGFEQLDRRITMTLCVEKDKISLMKYKGYKAEKIPAPGSGKFVREIPYYMEQSNFENYISYIKDDKNYKEKINKIIPKVLEKLHDFEKNIDKNIGLKLGEK